MSIPHIEPPNLPEHMTWEELQQLPDEIADFIELRDGRPVWMAEEIMLRHGPVEHQRFSRRMTHALESAARRDMTDHETSCWEAEMETNVFLVPDKSSYLTPDFMVNHCREEFGWVFATDVVIVGEVLSPSNTLSLIEAKKSRYAAAGIPWYWEVELAAEPARISAVRAFGLTTSEVNLPEGVTPLRAANYIIANEWTPETDKAIQTAHPFLINIPWSEVAF